MAEPAQPQNPGAPGSIRDQFMARLAAEREAGAPSDDAQPPPDEIQSEEGETSEAQPALEADTVEDIDLEAPSDEDAQPGEDDESGAITVNGKTYDAKAIEELESRFHEMDSKTKRTWRDQANEAAHRTREFASSNELLEVQDRLYTKLARGNLDSLTQVDLNTIQTPEQFRAYQEQRQRAEAGAAQLEGVLSDMKSKRAERLDALKSQQAEASLKVLKETEPRWDPENKFYGELRAFAVDSGYYSESEFDDMVDWRQMAGLIAIRDVSLANSGEVVTRETKKPNSQKQRPQKKRRNARGQYQSARQRAMQSKNARADGSFREMKEAQLRAERE